MTDQDRRIVEAAVRFVTLDQKVHPTAHVNKPSGPAPSYVELQRARRALHEAVQNR